MSESPLIDPQPSGGPKAAPPPALTREEALCLIRGGPSGIEAWNLYRSQGGLPPDLSGVTFFDASVERVGQVAQMDRVNLSNVKMRDAWLQGVRLWEANFTGADLTGANLSGARLSRADMTLATLAGANLSNANLRHATLICAELERADLSGARLAHADLKGADLSRASLLEAHLQFADLSLSRLWRTDLDGADCRGAQFRGVKLRPRDDWGRRAILKLGDGVNWQTVRAAGSLQVLTKVSYIMLAVVPILAAVWLALRAWIEPAGLNALMPAAWGHAFFAALCAAAGHLIYQISAPDTTKEVNEEQFADRLTSGLPADTAHLDDRLTRAWAGLRELAALLPSLRHPNIVFRHGLAVWIPSRRLHFNHLTELEEDDERYPDGFVNGEIDAGLLRVAIEEGAKAEYALRARAGRALAGAALVLYLGAGALVLRLVVGQSLAVGRAIGWL